MKLLLVEDEKDLLNAYQKGLKAEGYGIDAAASAEDALDLLSYNQYDCIVLDLNLPKMSGMKLLEKIREQDDQVKIMIVSALHTVDHRIEGLDKGANDYLIKPFDFQELKARLRALMRRDFSVKPNTLKAGDFELDLALHQVKYKEKIIGLTVKEYSIFSYIFLNQDHIVSAEEILEKCWNEAADPFTDVMRVHIYALRKKIHEITERDDVILTVKGVGYRLNP